MGQIAQHSAEDASLWPPRGALAGMRVGLSGAMPDAKDLEAHGWSDFDIRMAVHYVVEGVLLRGGRVVHGNHPTYRPLVEAATGNDPKFWPGQKPVRMLVVSPYLKPLEAEQIKAGHSAYADIQFFGPSPDDKNDWPQDTRAVLRQRQESLAAMREQMAREIDALVCIGGRGKRPDVQAPGVQVEAGLAAARHKPVYFAAALGGFTQYLYNEKIVPEANRSTNGLSPADNDRLAREGDPASIAGLVVQGLEKYWRLHHGETVRKTNVL